MISIAHLDVIELQVEDLGVKSSRNFLLHPRERLERDITRSYLLKFVLLNETPLRSYQPWGGSKTREYY